MSTFPGDPHSGAEWEQQKPKLQELYIQKRHLLREVQKIMANLTPAFRATENQYKKRFRKWNWEKFPKAPKPSRCKPRAQPKQHESTSSSTFDCLPGPLAEPPTLGEPTQKAQPAKEINAFEALRELQEIMEEVTFSDQIWKDANRHNIHFYSFSPPDDLREGLSPFLRVSTIIYMPGYGVDTIGVGNGAAFTVAADMSPTRSDKIISSTFLKSTQCPFHQFQLLMVWDLGCTHRCRYLKTTISFGSLGSLAHRDLSGFIRCGNEKVGKMYPGFRTMPRVLLLTSPGMETVVPPLELLWKLFRNLGPIVGEVFPPRQLEATGQVAAR